MVSKILATAFAVWVITGVGGMIVSLIAIVGVGFSPPRWLSVYFGSSVAVCVIVVFAAFAYAIIGHIWRE